MNIVYLSYSQFMEQQFGGEGKLGQTSGSQEVTSGWHKNHVENEKDGQTKKLQKHTTHPKRKNRPEKNRMLGQGWTVVVQSLI